MCMCMCLPSYRLSLCFPSCVLFGAVVLDVIDRCVCVIHAPGLAHALSVAGVWRRRLARVQHAQRKLNWSCCLSSHDGKIASTHHHNNNNNSSSSSSRVRNMKNSTPHTHTHTHTHTHKNSRDKYMISSVLVIVVCCLLLLLLLLSLSSHHSCLSFCLYSFCRLPTVLHCTIYHPPVVVRYRYTTGTVISVRACWDW